MTCFHPLKAYRSSKGRNPNGKWPIVFDSKHGYEDMQITVACGQCIGCRIDRTQQWATRCLHEAQMHTLNCFITLTYNDDHYPPYGSLNVRDFQLFIKRLRRLISPLKIKYFHCGEYGDLGRPHHHACIFGWDFPDRTYFPTKGEICRVYTSEILKSLWLDKKGNSIGYTTVGDVTFQSAAYVARYILKKVTGDNAEAHYGRRLPEYINMSLKTGIGKEWYDKFKQNIYIDDRVVIKDGLIRQPSRYYDKKLALEEPKLFRKIEIGRRIKAKNDPGRSEKNLLIKKEILIKKLNKLYRSYENDVTLCNS